MNTANTSSIRSCDSPEINRSRCHEEPGELHVPLLHVVVVVAGLGKEHLKKIQRTVHQEKYQEKEEDNDEGRW